MPEKANSGIIPATMVTTNKTTGLNPVEDLNVPEDYTFSVPIFQKELLSSDNNYTGLGTPYERKDIINISNQTIKLFKPIQTN